MFLSGDAFGDDSFLLVLHADTRAVDVQLPGEPWAHKWEAIVDTGSSTGLVTDATPLPGGARRHVPGRTLLLLRAC